MTNFSLLVGLLAAVAGKSPTEACAMSAVFHDVFGDLKMTDANTKDAIAWFAMALKEVP